MRDWVRLKAVWFATLCRTQGAIMASCVWAVMFVTAFPPASSAAVEMGDATNHPVIPSVQTAALLPSPFDDRSLQSRPRHTIPEHLPALVREIDPTAAKPAGDGAYAQYAMAHQVYWRYDNHRTDFEPWFQAYQSRRQAAMTGSAQLTIMALVFLLMAGFTAGLWRQTGRFLAEPSRRNQPKRRIR